LALSKGWWLPGAVLHVSDETVELSRGQPHDDSTLNIVIINF